MDEKVITPPKSNNTIDDVVSQVIMGLIRYY